MCHALNLSGSSDFRVGGFGHLACGQHAVFSGFQAFLSCKASARRTESRWRSSCPPDCETHRRFCDRLGFRVEPLGRGVGDAIVEIAQHVLQPRSISPSLVTSCPDQRAASPPSAILMCPALPTVAPGLPGWVKLLSPLMKRSLSMSLVVASSPPTFTSAPCPKNTPLGLTSHTWPLALSAVDLRGVGVVDAVQRDRRRVRLVELHRFVAAVALERGRWWCRWGCGAAGVFVSTGVVGASLRPCLAVEVGRHCRERRCGVDRAGCARKEVEVARAWGGEHRLCGVREVTTLGSRSTVSSEVERCISEVVANVACR